MNDFLIVARDALANIVEFIPKLLLFIVILVVGILLAKLLSTALEKLLERVGFDRLVERGGVKRALDKSKFDASDIIAKILYYTLVLFVLQFAFSVFGPNAISDLLAGIISFLPRIIVAIIIVVIAAAIAAGVKEIIQASLGGLSYGRIVANIASFFILFLGVIAALNQVEIATTVTIPVLITVLAIIGGILIVGVGGGLIRPMQQRWETILTKAQAEAPKVKAEAADAPPVSEQVATATTKVRRTAAPRTAPAATTDPFATDGAATEALPPATRPARTTRATRPATPPADPGTVL